MLGITRNRSSMARGKIRSKRTMLFTFFAALFGLASLFFLEGFTEGLMPWKVLGCPGCEGPHYDPGLMRWHGAEHGATVGLLMGGCLFLLLWRARFKPVLLQFYALAHIPLIAGYVTLRPHDTPLPAAIAFAIESCIVIGALVATYPNRHELFRFRTDETFSRPLLALTLVAAAVLLPLGVRDLIWQVQGVGGINASVARWTGAAVLSACLVLAGVLAAAKRPGWRELSALVGVTYLYLGAAALAVPNQAGSWGVAGGLLSILGGVAYLAVSILEGRSAALALASDLAAA